LAIGTVGGRHRELLSRRPKRTPTADALTDLIIDLLRLNGLLVTAGDRMVAGLGWRAPAGRSSEPSRAWRSRTSTRLAASSRSCGRSSSWPANGLRP